MKCKYFANCYLIFAVEEPHPLITQSWISGFCGAGAEPGDLVLSPSDEAGQLESGWVRQFLMTGLSLQACGLRNAILQV
jgi:hypothetical protein